MASSGSFSGSIHGGHYVLRVDWKQTKDITNNRSTITATMVLVNDWTLYISGRTNNTCTIDGQSQAFSSPAVDTTGSHTLGSVTKTVNHNSDGSKTLNISAVFHIEATLSGTYYSTITASASITLDSIPRASSVSASSISMGTATTINISRAVSSFTHTLVYRFGNTSGTIANNTAATSLSWTPPISLASQIPNSTSGTCTITCYTYNGGTYIGSKATTISLYVPSTVKPTIGNLTASRIDGTVPSDWGVYVQYKSKATLSISGAAGSYGSTIRSYSITGGGFSGTSSSLTTGYLNDNGTITFTAKVTDSRGRTSDAKTVSISVLPYYSPRFLSVQSQRADSTGTPKGDGSYVRGLLEFYYASVGGKNTITTSVSYKKESDTTWTDAATTFTSNTPFTFGSGSISPENTYEVKYTLTDAFTSISITDSISTAAVVMDFKNGGNGLAIGKVSETEKCFEVAPDWSVKVYGMMLQNYIQSLGSGIPFGTCNDAADVVEKTGDCPDFHTLQTGAMVLMKFMHNNTATLPRININGTGLKYIVNVGRTAVGTNYWRPEQTVILIYDGVYWVALTMPLADTTYFGITKLSTSTSSTSLSTAATSSAVKAAYDRNSWPSISLTSPLAVSSGGTGASYASAARTNLGITATSLYSGAITTGSTTFSKNYNFFVIIGQPSTASSRCALVVPSAQLTTTATNYQIADESNFYAFKLYYSGTTVTLAYYDRSSNGQIIRVFGVN